MAAVDFNRLSMDLTQFITNRCNQLSTTKSSTAADDGKEAEEMHSQQQPAKIQESTNQLFQSKLIWTTQVGGRFHTLMAQLIETSTAVGPSKHSEWKAAYEQQYVSVKLHEQRQPYRSPLVLALDRIVTLFKEFHGRHPSNTRSNTTSTSANSTSNVHAVNSQLVHLTVFALVSVGQFLLRTLDVSYHRARTGGRELLPLLLSHQESFLIAHTFRDVCTTLSPNTLSLVNIIVALQATTSRILEAIRLATKHWCDQTWCEIMPKDGLIRQSMPYILPALPNYSVTGSSPTNGTSLGRIGITPGQPTSGDFVDPLTAPSTPSSPPHPTASSTTTPVPRDQLPTPLLPMIEEYVLPTLHAAGECGHPISSGLFLSAALESVLESFLHFLFLERVKINQQGAARFNVEARWLYEWFQFHHFRSSSFQPTSTPPSMSHLRPTPPWPLASSLFLTCADLPTGFLPETTLTWWRECMLRLPIWNRLSAGISVLLQPDSYRLPIGQTKSTPKKKAKQEIGGATQLEIPTWSWKNDSTSDMKLNGTNGVASINKSNKVAPIPPALQSDLNGSIATQPLPHSTYTSFTDRRGLSLTNLSDWLDLTSTAHASQFVIAGPGRSTVVDWPV